MKCMRVTMEEQRRILWIDQLRGIALFFVVVGHVALPPRIKSVIYSFHMPLFFIISGLTLNNEKIQKIPLREYVKDKAKKLILPYFWMSFLVFPLWYFTFHVISHSSRTIYQVILGILFGNDVIFYTSTSNALWFLLVLFFAEILYTVIIKLTHGDKKKTTILMTISAITGYLQNGIGCIWHMNVAFTAVVFLYIGKLLMDLYKKHTEFFESKRDIKKYRIIFGLMVVGCISHICNGRISMTANKFGRVVVLFYITSCCFSIAIMLVTMVLPKLNFLNYIGRNTLLYVGCHIPVIKFFEKAYSDIFDVEIYAVLLAGGVYLGMMSICWLSNKYFPYVCGKASFTDKNAPAIWKVLIVTTCGVIPVRGVFEYFHILEKTQYMEVAIFCVTLVISTLFVGITNQRKDRIEYT